MHNQTGNCHIYIYIYIYNIQGACAHSAGPVYGFVSLWCVGLILFWFWDQILCEKPTCGDRFQILFISCKIQPGASKMVPKCSQKGRKWSQKGPTWSQQGPKWSQKGPTLTKRAPLVTKMLPKGAKMEPEGPNLAQNGAEREPKNTDKSMPEKRSAPGRSPSTGVLDFWSLFCRKGRSGDLFWRLFLCIFPPKMWSKIVDFCVVCSLLFMCFPNPILESIFGGSRCQPMLKSLILDPFWFHRGATPPTLKRHFRQKRLQKSSNPNYGEPPGADLGAIWRQKRYEGDFVLIWSSLCCGFYRFRTKSGCIF